MKDLLSKRHFWYKVDTLLAKGSAYPPFIDTPSFIRKSPASHFMIFQKFQPRQ